MPLEEYKSIVGTTAAAVTIAQFFSPIFICKQIIKQGNTKKIDPTPFIGGLGMAILMFQHALILNDMAMIPVNIVAFVLNTIYFGIYYTYDDNKSRTIKQLVKTIFFALLLVGYAQIDARLSPKRLEMVYGAIVTALMFVLIGAPLFQLKKIIATKNTEELPFPMILSGTAVTFLWLLYGIILDNIFIKAQNSVGFILCTIQLVLCFMYPTSPKDKKNKKKKK